jgi:hypothetical protein
MVGLVGRAAQLIPDVVGNEPRVHLEARAGIGVMGLGDQVGQRIEMRRGDVAGLGFEAAVIEGIAAAADLGEDGVEPGGPGIRDQLAPRGLGTLSFDERGIATPGSWQGRDGSDRIRLNQTIAPDHQPHLHIEAREICHASWRTQVRLAPGRYRFEGRVRSRNVEALSDDKGEGAGLRISGRDRVNGNRLTGTSDWKALVYPFAVNTSGESVELICEVRANKGEVWFDTESLRLVRESR